MKPINKDLPLYDIVMNDDVESGMYRISLVGSPAIQENFIYFSSEEKDMMFVDDEKGIIVGPVIVPDKPIYRRNESGEYYVKFSRQTIEEMMQRYAEKGLHNSFNIQHQFPTEEVYMLEMWMKEGEQDKSNMYGFDLPIGTVFAKAFVKSEVVRNEIKSSGLNGFSIEIKNFDMVEQKFESEMDFKFAVELGERLAKMEAKVAELEQKNETLMELWAEGQNEFAEVAEQPEEVKAEELSEEVSSEAEVAVEESLEEVSEVVAESIVEEVALAEQAEEPASEENFEEQESVKEAEMALSAEQEGEGQKVESVDKTIKFERITPEKINMIDKFFGKRLY